MGNWKHRRRFYYREYKDPASSYYNHVHPPPPLPAFAEDGVPLWEKKFCSLILPWQKIVNAKKFIYCHHSVTNWDDSAAEHAFQNAKRRFWAEMNRQPSQISLPDPDMYIEEINWHPHIDPELVKDLERAFFAPGDRENKDTAECKNKMTENTASVSSQGWKRNEDEVVTSWDCDNKTSSIGLKEQVQGWNNWRGPNNCSNVNNGEMPRLSSPEAIEAVEGKTWGNYCENSQGLTHSVNHVKQVKNWDNSGLNNNDNPWDRSISEGNNGSGTPWGDSSNKIWGFNHSGNQAHQSKEWDSGGNPWKCSNQNVRPVEDKAWGNFDHKCWGNNKQEPGKFNNGGYSQQNKFTRGNQNPRARQWRDGGKEKGWKQWDSPYRVPKDIEFRQQDGGGWHSWDHDNGRQKREGSHVTGNKHTRSGGMDYQASNHFSGGANKRRVGFAPE